MSKSIAYTITTALAAGTTVYISLGSFTPNFPKAEFAGICAGLTAFSTIAALKLE
jgi:hypothetical protein